MKKESILQRQIPKNAALFVVNDLLDVSGIADDPDVEENLVNLMLMQVMKVTGTGNNLFVFVTTPEMKSHIGKPDMIVSNQPTADTTIVVDTTLANPIIVPAKTLSEAQSKLKQVKHDLAVASRR